MIKSYCSYFLVAFKMFEWFLLMIDKTVQSIPFLIKLIILGISENISLVPGRKGISQFDQLFETAVSMFESFYV